MKRTGRIALLAAAVFAHLAPPHPTATASPQQRNWDKRWVYVSSNLYVDENVTRLEELLQRAVKAGYNGVLFADYKMFTWWTLDGAARWKANAGKLREMTRALGLELVICIFPFGRAESLLRHDANLASGMPVKESVLIAREGLLVPEQTARILNGSFEAYEDHRASRFAFQDDPGRGSFIDTGVAKHGSVSLRFEDVGKANPHGHGRICQKVEVRPWQQYRIRAWIKTESLTAAQVQLAVLAKGRALQYQFLSLPQGNQFRALRSARALTTDWVEQSVAFNSLDHTQVNVYAGIWGGETGKFWVDDLRIETVPALNLLRREALPLRVTGEDGTLYEEGVDFEPLADPGLGRPWPAEYYDTRHDPPAIRLTGKSRIADGQRVRLYCYHCAVVYDGQVNCSMDDPAVFALCEEQVKRTRDALESDGYFMSHDEIRCAGWEPGQTAAYRTTGELFADNIRRCYDIARRTGGGKAVYVWSDMYDPHHNARAGYYLVNNTIAGSWEGLNRDIIIMKWGGGERARPGLEFFADRGHCQLIAAYYDGDVEADHRMWLEAGEGLPGIIGVMYTTWKNDYRNLEKFAMIWWQGEGHPGVPAKRGHH